MLNRSASELLRVLPAILIGLTIHELAHAFVALRLGDDTARQMGRVTLNPLKHIDPVGFLMLLVAGFGWAKPVLINRAALKNPARDDTLIALAGPVANLLLAFLLVLMLRGSVALGLLRSRAAAEIVVSTLLAFISINVSLGIFNLLPIPPLDGSHVVWNLLSLKSPASSAVYFRYGSFVLLALVVLERTTGADILPVGKAVDAVVMALLRLVGLV